MVDVTNSQDAWSNDAHLHKADRWRSDSRSLPISRREDGLREASESLEVLSKSSTPQSASSCQDFSLTIQHRSTQNLNSNGFTDQHSVSGEGYLILYFVLKVCSNLKYECEVYFLICLSAYFFMFFYSPQFGLLIPYN